MTRIAIFKHIVRLKIFTDIDSLPKRIEIINGEYNHKTYGSLIIDNETLILDGELPVVIASQVKMVDISYSNIYEMMSEKLKDNSIYINKIEAVPEGKERELLKEILEMF